MQLQSPFSVMYLDDVSLGGPLDDILHVFNVIVVKSEMICVDAVVRDTIITALPWSRSGRSCKCLPPGVTHR